MRGSPKVVLVVDRAFGDRIAELSKQFAVWAVDSPENTPVIRRCWSHGQQDGLGVTSFVAGENESPEEMCDRIASTVDEHHGKFSQDPPWCEIEVYGVSLSPTLRAVFEEMGASEFEPTPDGFLCRRLSSS
jgi:hypothetical protein